MYRSYNLLFSCGFELNKVLILFEDQTCVISNLKLYAISYQKGVYLYFVYFQLMQLVLFRAYMCIYIARRTNNIYSYIIIVCHFESCVVFKLRMFDFPESSCVFSHVSSNPFHIYYNIDLHIVNDGLQ